MPQSCSWNIHIRMSGTRNSFLRCILLHVPLRGFIYKESACVHVCMCVQAYVHKEKNKFHDYNNFCKLASSEILRFTFPCTYIKVIIWYKFRKCPWFCTLQGSGLAVWNQLYQFNKFEYLSIFNFDLDFINWKNFQLMYMQACKHIQCASGMSVRVECEWNVGVECGCAAWY